MRGRHCDYNECMRQYNLSVDFNKNVNSKWQNMESKIEKWAIQFWAYLVLHLKWWLIYSWQIYNRPMSLCDRSEHLRLCVFVDVKASFSSVDNCALPPGPHWQTTIPILPHLWHLCTLIVNNTTGWQSIHSCLSACAGRRRHDSTCKLTAVNRLSTCSVVND